MTTKSAPRFASLGLAADIPDLELDVQRIIETVERLRRRIQERFPGSGLGNLCATFHSIVSTTAHDLERVSRPILWIRVVVGIVLIVLGTLFVEFLLVADLPSGLPNFLDLVEALEAAGNLLIFVGLLLVFLFTLETRVKRRRALHFLRELRALAHIIDMHQLTKDPDHVVREVADTASSPERDLQQMLLGRYLDYASEMLSLVGKVAALYAQRFDDPVVLAAVDEVESLTTGLSSKIWQKIMIL